MGTTTTKTEPPLVLHTESSRVWGGQEIRVLTELREMRRLGFRVGLIAPPESELARRCGNEAISVHEVRSFAKLNPRAWQDCFRLVHALRPAVLNTHSSEDSWVAGGIARLCRVPLIIRTRHVLAPVSSTFSYSHFPHLIFTCSEAIATQLAGQGLDAGKMVAVPTGNDEQRFGFSQAHRQAIRQRYRIDQETILVGNVGFLRSYKGQRFIVRTAAAMPTNYRFMIVGGGSEELSVLQSLIRELGVEQRVFLVGHQEHPEQFYSAFDLFFFSSYQSEGVSQALVQSLLNGLSVLACAIPSTREVLAPVATHRLVEYDDVDAACQGLGELAALPRRAPERMARQQQETARRYGVAAMINRITQAYAQYGIVPPGASPTEKENQWPAAFGQPNRVDEKDIDDRPLSG